MNPTTKSASVLIIEPDSVISDLLQYNLSGFYEVAVVRSAEEAMKLRLTDFELVVTETSLPGISGLDFAKRLQGQPSTRGVALIFCSSSDSEDDIIRGFDSGADDYVVKPFSLREMVARIRSVIRRHAITRSLSDAAPAKPLPDVINHGTLRIDLDNQTVEVGGAKVSLSKTEYRILALLVKSAGNPVTRETIGATIWPDDDRQGSRAVDVNISRLRKKLGSEGNVIVNKPGIGYVFEA